jgi:NADPH:quinone reductase-like Zn-dependent oxidoreductase
MKAFVYREFGTPEVLRMEEFPKPVPASDEVLVHVRAAAANPLDYHYMKGFWPMRPMTGIRRPKRITCGVDFAGVVEAAGRNVLHIKPGDEVFGCARGSFGEYVSAPESKVALKGKVLSFEDAAAIPVAAITALQALRDKAQLKPGQAILINGASGGVGSYAVQIAHSMGADTTAVCSTRNMDLMRSLGADHVIDYSRDDFTKTSARYDFIFDAVGNQPVPRLLGILKPDGVLLNIGVRPGGKILGPIPRLLRLLWASWFASRKVIFFIASINPTDLGAVRDMIESGKVRSVIDRVFPFKETPAALSHLLDGHVRGKVVVAM